MTADELLRRYDAGERDFRGADLTREILDHAHLTGADLTCANLTGANLSCAYLTRAQQTGANLGGAHLGCADLRYADLGGAQLSGAQLSETQGIIWAAVSWTGHGERGRQLLAIAGQDDGVTIYHCGCFRGDREAIVRYIQEDDEALRPSRMRALSIVDELLADGGARR